MKVIVLIIVFTVGSIFLFFKKEDTVENIKTEEILKKVEVEDFVRKKFSKIIKLRGFSNASRIVILKSQVEGRISSKQFDKGKYYKAGTQLLLIDPEDKVARVKEMEALLNQRKKEYEVAESLFQKGFRSEVKLSQSRTNFENALAKYEKSQVELNNTKVSMPFDSSIDESYVELGDYLKKGDPIAKIVDLNPIFINTSANEKEIINIKLNQKASVRIGNMSVNGTVNYISKTSDKNTRNFQIQVKVINNNFKILSGLSSEIEIKSEPIMALFIPSSLITLNNKGEIGIKIIENEIVRFIPVSILSDNGNGYWINVKDEYMKNSILTIITQGQDFTLDGEKVELIKNND